MREDGDIAAVLTQDGKRLEADLFVDCTGFAALLIEKKLGIRWIDCSQWLLCNRALTMPLVYLKPNSNKSWSNCAAKILVIL
jgi:tryptophan halogenase